ncbi:MAG: type II secretion system protein [Phycisphaerales bacterium JB063]
MRHPRPFPARAFTLIELLIIVSILGILASIVIPRFANSKALATNSALTTSVSGINTKLADVFARTGEWPATIEPAWFIGGEPDHVQNTFGVPMIQTVTTDGLEHPADKVLKAGVGGAYWYNPNEGVFRARVVDQGSAAATLDLYNQVNNASEAGLGNY